MNSRFGTLVVITALLMGTSCINGGSGFSDFESDESKALDALSDPYASLGTDDESAQFNDNEVASVEALEEDISDPYAPASEDEEPADGCNVYHLFIRWGQLEGFNASIDGVTHWSGDVSVNAGTLAVVKTVAFDFNDYLLDRTDQKIISFVSNTRPHFDGLRIRYEVCEDDIATLGMGESAALTFSAPDAVFTKTYSVDELQDLNDLNENINANGDRFHAQAIQKSDLCQGTLQGQWVQKTENYGVFKGIVVAANGIRVGYVRGLFGEKEGEQKWAAKFISGQGRFGGIMTGSYSDGTFTGDIHNREKTSIGQVEGAYVGDETGVPGTFSANYTLDCADVPAENE